MTIFLSSIKEHLDSVFKLIKETDFKNPIIVVSDKLKKDGQKIKTIGGIDTKYGSLKNNIPYYMREKEGNRNEK